MMSVPPPCLDLVTCPKCGSNEISFTLVYGTSADLDTLRSQMAEHTAAESKAREDLSKALRIRLSQLQQEAAEKAKDAKRTFEEASAQRDRFNANLAERHAVPTEEEQAYLLMQNEGDLRADYQKQVAAIRARLEATLSFKDANDNSYAFSRSWTAPTTPGQAKNYTFTGQIPAAGTYKYTVTFTYVDSNKMGQKAVFTNSSFPVP